KSRFSRLQSERGVGIVRNYNETFNEILLATLNLIDTIGKRVDGRPKGERSNTSQARQDRSASEGKKTTTINIYGPNNGKMNVGETVIDSSTTHMHSHQNQPSGLQTPSSAPIKISAGQLARIDAYVAQIPQPVQYGGLIQTIRQYLTQASQQQSLLMEEVGELVLTVIRLILVREEALLGHLPQYEGLSDAWASVSSQCQSGIQDKQAIDQRIQRVEDFYVAHTEVPDLQQVVSFHLKFMRAVVALLP
ncbi:MAG: hypothetical protein AAFV07_17985, partial [Bacteroidota bacterium]